VRKQTLSFGGLTPLQALAKVVQDECVRVTKVMSGVVVINTPIWSGRMVNSWEWSKDMEFYKPVPFWDGKLAIGDDGKRRPANPLPRPTIDSVTPNFTFKLGEFPNLFLTCSVDWAYEVDQATGRRVGRRPAHLVKHCISESVRL
jgi:hypothetical protein